MKLMKNPGDRARLAGIVLTALLLLALILLMVMGVKPIVPQILLVAIGLLLVSSMVLGVIIDDSVETRRCTR